MKILRLQHNVETRITDDFVAVGIGVDYINYPNRGISGKDLADLTLTEQVWFTVPLFALDRKGNFGTKPYGFKFAHPILLKSGEKALFATNQNVGADDIHLLFYGFYVPDEQKGIIQKRPMNMIYLNAFEFDANQTAQKLPIPHAYQLLSYGYLYSWKWAPLEPEYYGPLEETIKGYLEIIGRRYLFDEQKARTLNLYSDFYYGYRSLVNDYNLKGILINGDELLKLNLATTLAADTSLYIILEYEKISSASQPTVMVKTPKIPVARVKPLLRKQK